ncbi:hypothetical protein AeRB84_006523 [Aphanomyces euteiches]|nr:hypothetical protein AeRB84_006523 [Aphanomyces euteiches]
MGLLERFRLSSILTMQWHLIGRVDDMMKLQFCNFSFNPAHPFTLICQMRWSKNISEERESPRQILLGSMDERLCVLLNLAVYVELIDSDDPERVEHGFLCGNGYDGDRLVRDMLHRVLENAGFKKLVDGNLGTHNIRKGPATYASRNGMSRENIELRGRWRGHKKQVDTYIHIDRPLPDANAASCLCGPSGAVLYSIENTKWCTDSFLCEFIAPNASKLFTPQVGAVLAKPLLYAAVQKTSQCDPEFELIPDSLRQKILHHVHIAGNYKRVDDIQRLVTRIPITIRGFGDELIIDEIGLDNTPSVSAGSSSLAVMKELNAVGTMVMSLKRRIEEIETSRQNDGAAFKSYMDMRFDQLHSITKRIAQFPVPVPRQQLVELAPSFQSSRRGWLSKRPRDLYDLWREYEFGLGGSKPPKEFTAKERGACKWIYSTRLAFWKLVTALINRNHTSDTAIDAVYGAYGRSSSVTHILSQIRVDKSSGHFRGLLS